MIIISRQIWSPLCIAFKFFSQWMHYLFAWNWAMGPIIPYPTLVHFWLSIPIILKYSYWHNEKKWIYHMITWFLCSCFKWNLTVELIATIIWNNYRHIWYLEIDATNIIWKHQCVLLVTKSHVLLGFVALIYNERKCKLQLEVSRKKDVDSKFIDPTEVTGWFD